MFNKLKSLLPGHPVPTRIWRGPFRGARVVMNRRVSLRKILGLYEHELNDWLDRALPQVSRVLDVGANDGYFTFGCAAAFRRLGIRGEIVGIEAQEQHVRDLRQSLAEQSSVAIPIRIVHAFAGRAVAPGVVTLDALETADRVNTLIKLDVEGAEEDVIGGASTWMHPSNRFVIEVHRRASLARLQQAFAAHGLKLVQVDQRPLPWLGREQRDVDNWWLVSETSPR